MKLKRCIGLNLSRALGANAHSAAHLMHNDELAGGLGRLDVPGRMVRESTSSVPAWWADSGTSEVGTSASSESAVSQWVHGRALT